MTDIMIIDNNASMGSFVSEKLNGIGHSVTCCEDDTEALDEISSRRPDVVLLDLYFRGFEDWDTLCRIKTKYPDLPVIIFSAYKNFLDDPRIEKADGFVIKSIYTNELEKKLKEILTQ